ncbi:Uncharacterised protein [Klebsiella pneumoniae]|uniref:Uncharacterized protein n=1 Tax=Klebsiella pneumoniae TaxID=573 RepID=A0A486V139_KLEPN|nr:hypothetical protein AE77_05121 [Klebsiella pneumoniae CHS 21]KMG78493.1 hypothetical protein SM60_04679 [Klebsiella pneumoniae]KMH24878.1 hypothetical protein SM70_04562 [Klebsiella pneumoniae]KMH92569.1 hypothetical protein SM82_04434 [Klebsiella pneumoniae]KMI59058.1 hypothetical protein SM96_04896 [Klebsiella pneumoniae]
MSLQCHFWLTMHDVTEVEMNYLEHIKSKIEILNLAIFL